MIVKETKFTPKRLLSLLLIIVMLLGMLPTAALAADSVEEDSAVIVLYSKVWNESNKELVRITDGNNSLTVSFNNFEPGDLEDILYSGAPVGIPLSINSGNSEVASYMVTIPEVPSDDRHFPRGHGYDGRNNNSSKKISDAPTFYLEVNAESEIRFTLKVEVTFKGGTKITASKEIAIKNNNPKTFKVQFYNIHPAGTDTSRWGTEQDILENQYCTVPGNPSLPGYTFLGWTDASGKPVTDPGAVKITSNTYFYAKWDSVTQEVTFNAGDGQLVLPEGVTNPATTRTSSGTKIFQYYVIPQGVSATKTGETFAGWKQAGDNTLYKSGDRIERITSAITLTAQYEKNYKVSYHANYTGIAGLPLDQDVSTGSRYEIPYTPTLTGDKLAGWKVYSGGGKDTVITLDEGSGKWVVTGIEGDITLEPVWQKIGEVTQTTRKVTFVRQDAKYDLTPVWPEDLQAEEGTTVTIPNVKPIVDGATFDYWYTKTTEDGKEVEVTRYQPGDPLTLDEADVQLFAKWTPKAHTITYDTTGLTGAALAAGATEVNYGESVTFTVTVDAGYKFDTMSVTANSVPLSPQTKVENQNGSTTYTYVFIPSEDTTVRVLSPEKEQFLVTLPFGEHFDAAFAAGTGLSKTVDYNGNVTFTITADKGYEPSVTYTGTARMVAADGKYTLSDIKSNVTVYAKVKQIPSYTIFYSIDDALFTSQSVTATSASATSVTVNKANLVKAAARTGYEFDGWYTDSEYTTKVGDTLTVSGDTRLYGRYKPVKVNISYEVITDAKLQNVTPATIAATEKIYGQAATLRNTTPTSDNYDFLGWAKEENKTTVVYAPGATVSEEITAPMTLYAVWAKKTYTISLSSGTGYSIHHTQSLSVEHGDTFSFRVAMSKGYSQTAPSVWLNWVNAEGEQKSAQLMNPTNELDGTTELAVYYYTTPPIYWNATINVAAVSDTVYDVTYKYAGLDGRNEYPTSGDTYMVQKVGWNETAAQPIAPAVEGYKFVGWYDTADPDLTSDNKTPAYNFSTPITKDTTIYAVFEAIRPTITIVSISGTGWTLANWKEKDTDVTPTVAADGSRSFTIAYGSEVTFDLIVEEGYDYSAISVAANGYALSRRGDVVKNADGTTTIHFRLAAVTKDTEISVTGIERKTITIMYNANARDDVSDMPNTQTVNYYVANGSNTTITTQEPKRTGYTFKGWSTNSQCDPKQFNANGATMFGPGNIATFKQDTTLYAIWDAEATTVTLVITDEFTSAGSNTSVGATLEYAYEGEKITLVGKLSNTSAQGTMTFYKRLKTTPATDDSWKLVGNATINAGGYGIVNTTVEPYDSQVHRWDYKVVFTPTTDEGYTSCEATDDLRVYSKAISWQLDTDGATAKNELTIYEDNNGTAGTKLDTGDKMIANNVYWIEIPTVVELDGGLMLTEKSDVLTVGTHYEVIWQYQDAKGDWVEKTVIRDSNWFKVDAAYSQYAFRALVRPVSTSIYTKSAEFQYRSDNKLVNDTYLECLYTHATERTELQETAITLDVTAPNEVADVLVNGATNHFDADHQAQFEGQTVTLTATVVKANGTTPVETGVVAFYKNGQLIATVPVGTSGQNTGKASFEATMSDYDTTDSKTAKDNKDVFTAKYVVNETYQDATTAAGKDVYIKSTTIKTPVIDSKLAGSDGKTATTYQDNLTGLLAGVEHTFTLRTDAAAADYSVVALDGRAVAAEDYTITWITKTGDNQVTTNTDGAKFVTSDNKVNDEISVRLDPKGNMTAGAESKKAIIGTKQGVTLVVDAVDAIKETTETDVYQLSEIELRATVTAAGENPTMQPEGLVQFYYVDGAKFVEIGELAEIQTVGGARYASIKTDQLPVTEKTNVKRDVTVTAVYLGNETFQPSENYDETAKTIKAEKVEGKVTPKIVTVYSSVVFNCGDENLAKVICGEKGIHITARDDNFKANEENVVLTLSDIYTLDRDLTADLLAKVAKLQYGVDYEVEWQKLDGASAEKDANGNYADGAWMKIGDGPSCSIAKVEQGAAYRAKITVKDTPIAKASFQNYQQEDNAGRRTYYSNVLLAEEGQTTANVILSTSNREDNFEGIVAGETVTINVLVSGTAKTTPYSKITATIKDPATDETVATFEENNVDGWNDFQWETKTPGFYELTVNVNSNNGFAPVTITRELIVRDGGYSLAAKGADGKTVTTTYNGRTQGLDAELVNFTFANDDVKAAAAKAWTVTYTDANGELVEPSQAGTYKAHIVLPGNTWWNEQSADYTFVIEKRDVSIEDIIVQEKVHDGTKSVDVQEIILKDAETDQTTTGLPTGTDGIINGDSVYAVATKTELGSENAGTTTVTVSGWELRGGDMGNYNPVGTYSENITVNRSQVYGETSADVVLKAGEKLPADAVYMIDQAGTKIDSYDVLYYLHTDTQIKQVSDTNEKGLYTVIARPKQDNYKGGVTMQITVGDATSYTAAAEPEKSTIIHIGRTAELYGATNGVEVTLSNKDSSVTATTEYYANGAWTAFTDAQLKTMNAGRYLVKVTASTGDVAYGIYTVTKALPALTLTTADVDYSARQALLDSVVTARTYNNGTDFPADAYFTISGETPIGFHKAAEGNVDKQMPTDAGTYTITWHYPETANYAAHEISKSFTVKQGEVTVTADAKYRWVNGSFPEMTATYTGLVQPADANGPDTSLSEFQVEPEFVFNGTEGFSNDLLAHVGEASIEVTNGLSRNYRVTYAGSVYKMVPSDPQEALAIYGLPYNGSNKDQTVVYYGDQIQLYAYGDRDAAANRVNSSSAITWSSSNPSVASVDTNGVLTILKPGTFTITLTRGSGKTAISVTTPQITAMKKELRVDLPDEDKAYNGSEQKHSTTFAAYDELYCKIARADTPLDETKAARTDIGTSKSSAVIASGSQNYWSQTYNGTFSIHDKEITVTPTADSLIYGEMRTAAEPTAKDKAGTNVALNSVFTAGSTTVALTDGYDRLDVRAYEILVGGTENMNYNVKYATDSKTVSNTPKSTVGIYNGVKFYSTTTKAKNLATAELNDATVYGEQANTLDWILKYARATTCGTKSYADNFADFDLTALFVEQQYEDCIGNHVPYKAANRKEGNTAADALPADRTAEKKEAHANYELVFGNVTNAEAANYGLTGNGNWKNNESSMTVPTGTTGFIGAAATDTENFIEGSANIAQRPIRLTTDTSKGDVQLYWRLPQSQLYTALLNVLTAEANSEGRGLAKGHTIRDLDLQMTINGKTINPSDEKNALGLPTSKVTVEVTVGDTNYVLEGGKFTFEVVLHAIQIEATYTTKTATGFTVLIKVHDENGNVQPLTGNQPGLSYEILRKVDGEFDGVVYARGGLTYQNRTATDRFGDTCGVYTATYSSLPAIGGTYFIQMYEYGVALKTNER